MTSGLVTLEKVYTEEDVKGHNSETSLNAWRNLRDSPNGDIKILFTSDRGWLIETRAKVKIKIAHSYFKKRDFQVGKCYRVRYSKTYEGDRLDILMELEKKKNV